MVGTAASPAGTKQSAWSATTVASLTDPIGEAIRELGEMLHQDRKKQDFMPEVWFHLEFVPKVLHLVGGAESKQTR